MFERVHMIWDIYDGPRSGLTDYKGVPHYFNCILADEGGYSEEFELFPIDSNFLSLAKEQWKIYREWEAKYHTGNEVLETHPGNRGLNTRYDELQDELDAKMKKLVKLDILCSANFQPLPNQSELPDVVLRDLEVEWLNVT
jgi:hypothetical protein